MFAEHGYHGAAMGEIARRSGVTVPVVYDHFPSKRALHGRLLERHFAELRQVWRDSLQGPTPEARMASALQAWFAYVEAHPYAWRMLFRETTGDPAVQAMHREIAARSRDALLPLLASEPGAEAIVAGVDRVGLELVWEVVRAVLQGLALWWYEHQDVPRERIVATAMNTLWIGFERAQTGETWTGAG